MTPFEFNISPAVAEFVFRGRATPAGIAATLVDLAGRGWIEIAERRPGDCEFRLKVPARGQWDGVLAYAVALGQGRAFLKNAREVCEYFERHLQGVVMTFYTPRWYAYRREPGQNRFAFLTAGMAELFDRFDLSRLAPADVSRAGAMAGDAARGKNR